MSLAKLSSWVLRVFMITMNKKNGKQWQMISASACLLLATALKVKGISGQIIELVWLQWCNVMHHVENINSALQFQL